MFDGLYDADEYADLMRHVDMDPSQLAAKPGEVRTNCTTRFGAEHSIRTEGVYRHVTSVFIPYGGVIFACFQTTKVYDLPTINSTAVTTQQQPTSAAPPSASSEPWPTSPVVPGGPGGGVQGRGGEWPQRGTGGPGSDYEYAQPHYPQDAYRPHSGYAGYDQAQQPFHARLASSENTPTPPRGAPGGVPGVPGAGGGGGVGVVVGVGGGGGGGSTRPLVRPPGDVEKCRGCGTRESPEWRKGENGVKDLCNACGLKLARAVAKREGRQKPRKKDKV